MTVSWRRSAPDAAAGSGAAAGGEGPHRSQNPRVGRVSAPHRAQRTAQPAPAVAGGAGRGHLGWPRTWYGVGMIKLVFCLRRLPHLSRAEFQRYWGETHGPLVRRRAEALGIRRYVQLHTLD